jgi:twitching motility two-component system response regulator PilH
MVECIVMETAPKKATAYIVSSTNDEYVQKLVEEFKKQSVGVKVVACDPGMDVTAIAAAQPTIIILNAQEDEKSSLSILRDIRNFETLSQLPVVALVDDTANMIQTFLSLGASDYITPEEQFDSVVQRFMKMLDSHNDTETTIEFSDIDISTPEVNAQSVGVRVYVVEDDPLLKNLLSVRFNKAAFPFEFNSTGMDVLAQARQFKPDVILLDIMLPGVNGLDILEQIRLDEQLKDVPVIVFSNRDSQADRERASALGADAFYVKAMTDLAELVSKIEDLSKHSSQPAK